MHLVLRHVIAGIDDSPQSLAAAHWAAREATRRGAALCLVHAREWHPRPAPTVPADMSERALAEELPERAANSMRAAHPGLQVIGQAPADSPVSALLKAAEQAELLVLGSRGLGGVAGFVMGSVSQQVVARASHPVVLVRVGGSTADEHFSAPDGISPDEIPGIPYRDVVLGLDTGRSCDGLIEFAFDAAGRRGSSLRVIHIFSRPPDFAATDRIVPVSGPELRAEQELAVAAVLRPWCEKFPEVAVTESVTEGRAADELISASADAALVVVGRRIRETRLGIHLGPVAYAALHHAPCPVSVVPHA
ncbi:universal stress protein [Streptomyces sp. NPDC058299]|uniref:universal stress protein n=1 Tax=Streptomyces sp. NPDC058299 TaxID=3346435 RepID=UPI0036E0AC44